jgi:hypothetical protein
MTFIRKLGGVLCLAFCFSAYSNAQVVGTIDPSTGVLTQTHIMGDDQSVNVPLQFGFPYYGQTFNNSWMYDNGVVSFVQPGTQGALPPWQWNSQSINSINGSNYFIAPLWTDLAPIPGVSSYVTDGNSTYQRYTWNSLSEYYSGGTRFSTFSLTIKPDGSIRSNYYGLNITQSNVSIGLVGNSSIPEEKESIHFSSAGTPITTGMIADWERDLRGGDICSINPLSSTTCSGYEQAYFDQQCSLNPLYNEQCPGYTQAYFDQQCSSNPLYNSQCPGYSQAYFTQQCSMNPLYDSQCPGYAQAYFTQQCSLNTLYNSQCPGYAQAYFNQQCSLNPLYNEQCPGYAQAYFNQQCSLNGLYDKTCVNYQSAFLDQQCGINPLYSAQCPGYAQAKLQKDLQDQLAAQTAMISEPTLAASSPTSVIASTATATTNTATADPTRTETVIATDVGGVELSTSGEITVPTGEPAAVKEAAKESVKAEEKKAEEQKVESRETERKRVDPRALSIAMAAVAATEKTAQEVSEQAVILSQITVGPADGSAAMLGSGITIQTSRSSMSSDETSEDKRDSVSSTTSRNNSSTETVNMMTQPIPSVAESNQRPGPSVRNGGSISGLEGGPDPAALARAPLDFNQYLNAQLKDSQFYQQKEIYRGQRTVDNARAQRFLNGASDSLHQRMTDQQYAK